MTARSGGVIPVRESTSGLGAELWVIDTAVYPSSSGPNRPMPLQRAVNAPSIPLETMKRGPVPPNKTGLVMLAAAVIPVVVQAAKPLAKAVGRGLIRAGQFLREAADAEPRKGETEAPAATSETAQAEATATVETVEPAAATPAETAPDSPTKVKRSQPRKKPQSDPKKKPATVKKPAPKRDATAAKKPKSASKSEATPRPESSPRKRRQLPNDLDVT